MAQAPSPRLELLGGELSVVAPLAAVIEPNRADSIMAAPAAASAETLVRMRDSSFHAVAIFRRLWLTCAEDPAGTILAQAAAWQTREAATLVPVATGGLVTYLYLPVDPPHRDAIVGIGSIVICAGAAGLVSANVMIEGDLDRGRAVMAALARSVKEGRAPAATAAREVSIPGCGTRLVVDTPDGYLEREEPGADFSVFRFQKVGTPAEVISFAIYVGGHPTLFAPSTSELLELPGEVTVHRWEDDGGVHLQRVVSDGGCTVHAFGVGPAESEPVIRGLIAFRIEH